MKMRGRNLPHQMNGTEETGAQSLKIFGLHLYRGLTSSFRKGTFVIRYKNLGKQKSVIFLKTSVS